MEEQIIKQLQTVIEQIKTQHQQETEWHNKMLESDSADTLIQYNSYKTQNQSTYDSFDKIDEICCKLFQTYTELKTVQFDNELMMRNFNTFNYNTNIQNDNDINDAEIQNTSDESLSTDEEILQVAEQSENV